MNPFIPETPTIVPERPPEPPGADAKPEAAAGAAKPQPRIWFEIVAVLGITLLPSIWYSIELWRRPQDWSPTAGRNIAELIQTSFQCYAVLYFIRIARIPLARIGIVRPSWSDLAIGLAILILNFGIEGILHRVVPRLFGVEAHTRLAEPAALGGYAVWFAARVVGAFWEELVARGYLITRIWDASGSPLTAVVLSATLFGVCHVYQGIHAILYAGVTGLLYGLGFVLCRRLWPFVLVHAVWNIVVVGRL